MWPFKPKWMSDDHGKALASVQQIHDEPTLKKIARSHKVFYAVKEAAFARITMGSARGMKNLNGTARSI